MAEFTGARKASILEGLSALSAMVAATAPVATAPAPAPAPVPVPPPPAPAPAPAPAPVPAPSPAPAPPPPSPAPSPAPAPGTIPPNAIWVSPGGSNSNPGTFDRPVATFAKAFTLVQPGGTVVARDGLYNQSCGGPNAQPPNGTPAARTRILAQTPGKVTVTTRGQLYPLDLRDRSYVEVAGFRFINGGEFCGQVDGGLNCWVHDTFFGNSDATNYAIHLSVVGEGHLIEDVWSCGRGRGIIAYGKFHKFRRYVVRLDSYTGNQGYTGLTLYDCDNTLVENCLALDFNPAPTAFDWKGGFRSRDQGEERTHLSLGSIALRTLYDGFRPVCTDMRDCLAMDVAGRGGIDEDNFYTQRLIRNSTVINSSRSGILLNGSRVRSSLLVNVSGANTPGDENHYDRTANAGGAGATTGDSKLLYPVRIEQGSPCKGTGMSGTDRGANILYRYKNGVLTTEPLWPWPNEDRIREDFRTDFGTPNPARGFCADGVDAWGQPHTLTRYVWQALGNQIPAGIY